MQWEIIRSLTEEFYAGLGRHGDKRRTIFVVGDRKQSIYSFQGADPEIFERVHDDFKDHARAAGRTFRDVDLSVSFRSAPEILAAVDAVFGRERPARRGLDGLVRATGIMNRTAARFRARSRSGRSSSPKTGLTMIRGRRRSTASRRNRRAAGSPPNWRAPSSHGSATACWGRKAVWCGLATS